MQLEALRIGAETFALDAESLAQVRSLLRADPAAAAVLARRKSHRTIPDGAYLRVSSAVADAAPPLTTENPMTTVTITLDGQSIAVDPRVAAEMTRLRQAADSAAGVAAALQLHASGGRAGMDRAQAHAAADAARTASVAAERARRAPGTPQGEYVRRLEGAWKDTGKAA